MTALLMGVSLLLDWVLGEPRRWHPLVGFGRVTKWVEPRVYADRRARGVLGVAVLILPFAVVAAVLSGVLPFAASALLQVLLLGFALGHRSLHDHAWPIADALDAGDVARAKALTSRIVSRDAQALDPAPAATESVLENGGDGVFGALFWFAVAGGPGALVYRLANTLDAMWGYRNARYRNFGWAAARFDDLLNWPVARLTALTYALLGQTRVALRCWRTQASAWDSPNAGPVMAAGAGALGVLLGGAARYDGVWRERPALGEGRAPDAADIGRALSLVRHGVYAWMAVAASLAIAGWVAGRA